MLNRASKYDCVIVGGGPAGALLACVLAEWGRKTALIDRGDRKGSVSEETLVPGARSMLKRHGLMASVRAHDFIGTRRHGIIWGDGELKWRSHDEDERGFKVVRELFDRDLRNIARSLSVDIYDTVRVRGPLPETGSGTVEFVDLDRKVKKVSAPVIVAATGKVTSGSLLPLALEHQLPATLALSATVEKPSNSRDATVIESVPQGWLWWLPLQDGRVCLTLFADSDQVRHEGRDEVFRGALADSGGPARGHDVLPSLGNVATPRLVSTPSGVLLIGDAASTIDPLSSQGLEKALVSAETAAVTVNTLIDQPDSRESLLQHHHQWEQGLYMSHARQSLHFYLQEARFSDHPFWENRHRAVEVEIADEPPTELPALIRLNQGICRRPSFQRRGRVYEQVEGYGLAERQEVLTKLGRIPIEPLLRVIQMGPRTDDVLKHAAEDARLYLLSKRMVMQALTELYRLGIIVEYQEG